MRAAALPDELRCAIAASLDVAARGGGLDGHRSGAIARARGWADELRPVSRKINKLMPPSVRLIASNVNTAFMAALIIATGWLDRALVERFVRGFPIVGDIPDSFVWKPDLAKAVNVFYLQMMALRASVYFDWVPSKANIADAPSRYAFAEARYELSVFKLRGGMPDPLLVPSVATWSAPLSRWASPRGPQTELPL